MKKLGLYIHIPFCQSKCYYCDFNSFTGKFEIVDKYTEFVKKELNLYCDVFKEFSIDTIFIGGGTPTLMDGKYIYEIFDTISQLSDLKEINEITIEGNPKTFSDEKLSIYKKVGINRISLGLQTFNNSLLKKLGRIHTVEDFYSTYEQIRRYGFNNINIDLMFNLPQQTIANIEDTLIKTIELDVEHISLYSLKVEEGTPFYEQYNTNSLILPDEDEERNMYYRSIEMLEKCGYNHYEISNFARPNLECKHNIKYWTLQPYLGVGLSAHSNLYNKRFGNVNDFESYFNFIQREKYPIIEKEIIDKKTEMSEYLILGLRLMKGIRVSDFNSKFGISVYDIYGKELIELEKKNLLSITDDNIRLTRLGIDLSNTVFVELLPKD